LSEELTTIATEHHNGHDDLVDEEEFVDAASRDADDVPERFKRWFPEDYVVAILGHRRSGKTALMAHYLLNGLIAGSSVYTNLELYPEKLNVKLDKIHKPLSLDGLLSFDPSLDQAIIGIEEIGTWVESLRAQSASNILLSKFFQLFIGKKGLRIFFTNQSGHLPYWAWEQVDMHIEAHDLFFTEWGREANLAKGTSFYYVATDKSGIFTGWEGTTWTFGLRKANNLWDKFNSYQQFDPLQWAIRTKIVGRERTWDMDEGRMYDAGEREQEMYERNQDKYKEQQAIYQSYGNKLIALALPQNAVKEVEVGQRRAWQFSIQKMEKTVIARLKGKEKEEVQEDWNRFRDLPMGSNDESAKYAKGGRVLILYQPFLRTRYNHIMTEANEKEKLD
jgi:hypothetical protein